GHAGQCVAKWTGPGARHGSHDFTLDGGSERLRSIEILANERRPTEQLRGNDTQAESSRGAEKEGAISQRTRGGTNPRFPCPRPSRGRRNTCVCGKKLKLVRDLVAREASRNGIVEVCGKDWSRFGTSGVRGANWIIRDYLTKVSKPLRNSRVCHPIHRTRKFQIKSIENFFATSVHIVVSHAVA
ncbi:hypothetical protein K0M31_012400, partial [Melipona bicolor]